MNRIVSLDTRDMHFAEHLFGPSPSCDCCQTRHMVRRPLKTFISSLCGIMPRLNVSSTSFMGFCSAWGQAIAPLPVANARPLLRPIPVSGKGIDAEHAERSCLGEAIERYSAIYQGSERRERASIDELGDACISPDQVFLFSERQYAQREQWNQIADEIGVTPVPLNSSATISWTAVQSLLGREKKFVPTAYCFLWYSDQAEPEIYQADSSGCAAGPDVAFAISSALLELIERDAVTIWWDNQIVRASWPIEQLDRKELITCRDSLAKSGRDFWLLDVTTDISVPACVAVSARTDGTEPYFAAAADLDASTAASRATAELVHLLASGDNLDANYLRWVRSARLGEHPYLRPHGSVIPPIGSRQMSSDRRVETCVRHLQQAGLSPYYLDLTRRETGIPAVRAIVPGLRHPWRRRARGRLYETPVQLGWLTEPRPEAELNPLTCVI
jgi:ribosomal protein S12 methylthiotransferase accessory factor